MWISFKPNFAQPSGMLNLRLIVIGKYKETYWKQAEAEYIKRLKPYARLVIHEIAEEPFRNAAERERIQIKEAEKIQKLVPDGSFTIALHERGRGYTSRELADFLSSLSLRGETLTFIIGGPLGLHENLLKTAGCQLSLSPLTFPHQMARVALLEQLYRAATILNGKTYHY